MLPGELAMLIDVQILTFQTLTEQCSKFFFRKDRCIKSSIGAGNVVSHIVFSCRPSTDGREQRRTGGHLKVEVED